MVQFTKKLIDFGGSKAIIIPKEVIELYKIRRGDFITLQLIEVKKQ